MSLIARTKYLAALAKKCNDKIKPIIEEFNGIKDKAEKLKSSALEQIEAYQEKLSIAKAKGNDELVQKIQSQIANYNSKVEDEAKKLVEESTKSLNAAAKKEIEDIDGLQPQGELPGLVAMPKLFNMNATFVKDTLTGPETMVPITTVVTGTSPAGPITGVGSQPTAKIITT